MGNILGSRKYKNNYYEKFLDSNTSSTNDYHLELQNKYENIEKKIGEIEMNTQYKLNEIQQNLNYNNEKIEAILNDLQALMNNDKLLLDKLIEKNIVSVIENH